MKLDWHRIRARRYVHLDKAGTRGWSRSNWFELTLVYCSLALFKNWFLFLLLHSIAQMTFLSTTLNILSIVININNNLNNNNNNNNRLNINAQSNNNIVTNTNVNNGNQVKFFYLWSILKKARGHFWWPHPHLSRSFYISVSSFIITKDLFNPKGKKSSINFFLRVKK